MTTELSKRKHLFAYGTLMCEDIMEEVSGDSFLCQQGLLHGYSRWCVVNEEYPAIAPDESGSVDGVVYMNVTDAAWDRLDRFEGEMYICIPVKIEFENGTSLIAETYVTRPEFKQRLNQEPWSFQTFLKKGKNCFQENYQGYQAIA